MRPSQLHAKLTQAAALLSNAAWQEGHAKALNLPLQACRWSDVAINALLTIGHLGEALSRTDALHRTACANAAHFWDQAVALSKELEAEGSFTERFKRKDKTCP